jgi:hypothetical protein
MKDPPRLSNDKDRQLALLLRAAQSERPPRRALEKTLATLSAGSAVIGASQAAAAGTAGKVAVWTITKWACGGLVSGLVTVGGAELVKHELREQARDSTAIGAHRPRPALPRTRAPSAANRPLPPASAELEAAPPPRAGYEPLPLPAPNAHTPATKIPERSAPAGRTPRDAPGVETDPAIAIEVKLIDEARRALAMGRARDALVSLARYRVQAPNRSLGPEAQYLEMEAQLALGDRDAARREAEALIARYPTAPQVARARWVLGDQIEAELGLP